MAALCLLLPTKLQQKGLGFNCKLVSLCECMAVYFADGLLSTMTMCMKGYHGACKMGYCVSEISVVYGSYKPQGLSHFLTPLGFNII